MERDKIPSQRLVFARQISLRGFKNVSSTTVPEACADAEVIILATPYPAAQDAIRSAGNLTGKVLIDCTNPLAADMKGLTVGLTTSAAENVAAWAKGARVVKCFNITGAQIMANPTFGSDHATMFLAGDDAEAKKVAGMLVETLEFEVCDTGPL